MNSLRRPYQIRLHDLRQFMRGYDPSSGNPPEIWAQEASTGLQPGSLVFLLEPVGAPFGLTSFARKEENESFRVSELAIVVRMEDKKPMVLNITNNSYELRFLTTLFEEKIRKAVLDHRKLCFVLAKPAALLSTNTINEIEHLANLYASGGSRRSFTNDEPQSEQEPLLAILTACGVNLNWPDSNKQPVDLGSVCYLLFTPEGRQQDKNRSQLKAKFVPIEQYTGSDIEIVQEDKNANNDDFNILNSWGPAIDPSESAANSFLFKRLTDELARKKPQQDDPLSLPNRPIQNEPEIDISAPSDLQGENNVAASGVSKPIEEPNTNKEVYQHISEAISGLLDRQNDPSVQLVANQIEERSAPIEEAPGTQINNLKPEPQSPLPEPEPESIAPPDFAIIDSFNESIVNPADDGVPAKLDDFQEPKVVISEMASLVNKLESQVARAAKKITVKTVAVEQQLTSNMSTLLATVTQEDKDAEAELLIQGDSLYKQFESLFENLKAEIAEKAATARQQIQAKCAGQQKVIEEGEKEHHEALTAALNENKAQFAQLVNDRESQLKTLVEDESLNLQHKLENVHHSLQEIASKFTENLSGQLKDFEKRIDEDLAVVLSNLENNTDLLSKNIDKSCQHSLEKLKKTKGEFEIDLKRLIDITEIALGRQIRVAQIEFFLPRLKEHKQLVETMMQEMEETFAEKLIGQSQAQLDGLANSLASAKTQLKGLVDECLTKLELIGRNQESGLEGLFTTAAHSLEENTGALLHLLKQAEQEITSSDATCKKLAETYSLDNDPAVTSLRQNIYARVDGLKAQVKNELESSVNNDCAKLEELIRNQHSKLNERRAELAQRVHFASDHGLQRIRAAIHDAYNAIQSEREKYME